MSSSAKSSMRLNISSYHPIALEGAYEYDCTDDAVVIVEEKQKLLVSMIEPIFHYYGLLRWERILGIGTVVTLLM